MPQKIGQTVARQLAMLRAIPRAPAKASAAEIAERVKLAGFVVSRRTIERDLHGLSSHFPLVLDERAKPYGWSWMKGAKVDFMPGLTRSQAVALLLVKAHLPNLLPRNLRKELVAVFDAAEQELASSGWRDWHARTAIVPATLPLLPPKIDHKVMEAVQTALAERRCIDALYRPKSEAVGKRWTIHPLGLLSRGPVLYLVCTLFDYTDVRQLALHRMSDAKPLAAHAREPGGFDFMTYASTEASNFHSRGKIRLVARFDAAAAEHLRETPLSSDQEWQSLESGDVVISATLQDGEMLLWWLLAFGSHVVVLSPQSLLNRVIEQLEQSRVNYRVG